MGENPTVNDRMALDVARNIKRHSGRAFHQQRVFFVLVLVVTILVTILVDNDHDKDNDNDGDGQ